MIPNKYLKKYITGYFTAYKNKAFPRRAGRVTWEKFSQDTKYKPLKGNKKIKKMAKKITLPPTAKLVFNLVMQNEISNKFYKIYTIRNPKSTGNTGTIYGSIYTEHGRIGHTSVVGLQESSLPLHLIDDEATRLCNLKIKKGYKKVALSTATSVATKVKKRPVKKVNQEPITSGRLSLILD